MADSPATVPFALLGLRRLNTSRSRETLAGIIQSTAGYSYWKGKAIKYLSEMRDKKYFPLLLEVAKEQKPNQAKDYVLAAAELGGEDALPYVVSLLDGSEPFSWANAIMALPRTGSRRAVPLLIEQLRNPSPDLGQLASTGLMELTHHSVAQEGRLVCDTPTNECAKWVHWWLQNGSTTPIYGSNQCGEVESLR
jgi:HEAT repeat protein